MRLGHVAHLRQGGVGWDGGHIGVGVDIEHGRAVGREGALPGRADLFGCVDLDGLQAEAAGESGIGDVGQLLRRGELRHPDLGPHLPGHLVEVVVVQHGHDQAGVGPLLPVPLDGDELGHAVHLHGAITHQGDGRTVGMGELGPDDIGHPGAHGGQSARERAPLVAGELEVAGVPVGGRSRVGGHDGVGR